MKLNQTLTKLTTKKFYLFIFNQTALHLAVQHGLQPIVELLIKSGASTDTQDIYNNTPLSKAQIKGNENIIHLLSIHKTKTRSRTLNPNKLPSSFARSKSNEFQHESPAVAKNPTFPNSTSLENIPEESIPIPSHNDESQTSD